MAKRPPPQDAPERALKRPRPAGRDIAAEYDRAVHDRACLLKVIAPLLEKHMPALDAPVCTNGAAGGKGAKPVTEPFLAHVLRHGVEGINQMNFIVCEAEGCSNLVEEEEAIENEGRDGLLCCCAHRRCMHCEGVLRSDEQREDYCAACQEIV